MKTLGVYIHIPFCKSKCLYCDFLSFPEGRERQALYFDALKKEIEVCSKECKEYLVDTVFVGGGTPTSVDSDHIVHIMELIKTHYKLAEDAEITIECNPGTADFSSLKAYREAGINRISIGLQSPDDGELKMLGRIHNRQQFEECYNNARRVGFTNVNVDLMGALPGQTLEMYENNLDYILKLDPPLEHISAYSLIIEEGTPFYDMNEKGQLHLPDEDTERNMYHRTKEILAGNGYKRYEISNYAKEGYECLHNIRYWKCREYIGFGLGAASFLKCRRFRNTSDFSKYTSYFLSLSSERKSEMKADGTGAFVREDFEELDRKALMEEFMFMGLRMVSGVSVREFEERFKTDIFDVYGNVISKLVEEELLERHGEFLRLTDRGLDVSNYCMAEFLL